MSKRSFDGNLCKNFFYFNIFSFYSGFPNMILSDALILPISQLQTLQLITSQIRWHMKYLKQTYCILGLLL